MALPKEPEEVPGKTWRPEQPQAEVESSEKEIATVALAFAIKPSLVVRQEIAAHTTG